MSVVGNFFESLATVIIMALDLYMWVVVARAVLSWVSPDPYNPIVRFLYSITDPVLLGIRRRFPLSFGGIDFSPVVVILAIIFLQRFLVASLHDLARQFVH